MEWLLFQVDHNHNGKLMMVKTETSNEIFTIGHSTHSLTRFVELLQHHHVKILADVRSMPYSRWQPHFNREQLSVELDKYEIEYVFLSVELGGMSDKDYCEMARTESFHSGIQRVTDECQHSNIALMCAEKDPIECHRALLVARSLVASGWGVKHILADGKLELHQDTLERLYEHLGHSMNQMRIFENTAEDRDDAIYKEQERLLKNRLK